MNKTLSIAALVFLMCAASAAGGLGPTDNNDCGTAVDGLQMCLNASGSNLQVTLRNVGDHDLTLNLGIMLANGKVQLPNQIAMKFTDALGKTRVFQFGDLKYGAIAGRVDPYVVPLRVGSTYTLQLGLDKFWCLDTKEFFIPLLSGENRLTAQFEGTAVTQTNLDMPGIALMHYWLGKVESNTVTLRR